MVTVKDIGWGSYNEFEGPLFWGVQKHKRRKKGEPIVSDADDIISVITTTEGGAYDAYNGYDKCICTSGLIQWCDRAPMFLVTKLLGTVAAADRALLAPVDEFLDRHGYTFEYRADMKAWRFIDPGGVEVDNPEKQQLLYLDGSSGLKGKWVEGHKWHAREWAAACSNVWQEQRARDIQREFTASRLHGFVLPSVQVVLLAAQRVGSATAKAFIAAFLSFAANNPRRAADALSSVVDRVGVHFTDEWLVDVLHSLTFKPGIAIYPHRYDKIRPVLEDLYGVDLPDFNGGLGLWLKEHKFKDQLSPTALQSALLDLGYDLGPKGADGVFGTRSKAALLAFEKKAGVPPEKCDGTPDSYTVPALEKALAAKGRSLDWGA
jgi:hypothetical protein